MKSLTLQARGRWWHSHHATSSNQQGHHPCTTFLLTSVSRSLSLSSCLTVNLSPPPPPTPLPPFHRHGPLLSVFPSSHLAPLLATIVPCPHECSHPCDCTGPLDSDVVVCFLFSSFTCTVFSVPYLFFKTFLLFLLISTCLFYSPFFNLAV